MATKKIRVYELARELGVENAVVLDLANELKIGVKSHSSSIDDPSADRVRRLADSKGLRKEPVVEEPEPEPAPPPPEPEKVPAVEKAPAPVAEPAEPEPAPPPPHRVVRSTGGLPEPAPLPPRPAPTREPTPAPGERREEAPAAASDAAAPPAPPAAPRSPAGRPIPPPPGGRPIPPPPGARPLTPSGPPRSGAPRTGWATSGAQHGGPGGGRGGGGYSRSGPGGPPGGPPGGRGGYQGRGRPGPQGQRPRRKKRRRRNFEDLGPAEHPQLTPTDAPVPEGEIVVPRGITIQELAPKLNRTAADLVRVLVDAGEMVTGTQSLPDEMLELIGETLGAQGTGIAVLVVAADDGVMPQTVEAISHAKAAEVPVIVAITKVDKGDADPQRTRQQLVEQELVPEEWGGDTLVVEVSGTEGTGIPELLDAILLVADVQDPPLMANPKAPARAFVLEANLDPGRGPVASVLVERGILHVGDPVVAGGGWGKVRALFDEHGKQVADAGPSMPVEVLGLDDVPLAGDELRVAPDEKTARTVAEARARRRRAASLTHPMTLAGGARLEDIFAMVQRGEIATLNLVLKADVQGSLEAVTEALRKIDQEHEEVRLSFVHRGVGGITESDITLAAVSNATVIGFNVRPDRRARELAETERVEMRLYEVIYQGLEDV